MDDLDSLANDVDMGDVDWKPCLGMFFDSEEDAYNFYNEYGRREGFGIRKSKRNKNKTTGDLTSRTLVCCKEGLKEKDKRDEDVKKLRQEVRTGCLARMSIRRVKESGKYIVYNFKAEHNHPLLRPELTHMLPSQRKISDVQAFEVELAEASGIRLSSAHELLGRQAGGRDSLGFTKLDQKNYLRSKRQHDWGEGEAGSILEYFRSRHGDNRSFFHAIQLDKNDQITNIFWADAGMILDYGHFGNFVSFDTTYKINKEHCPFGVFVGFNHHKETAVFGAALMYDETAESFVWLFQTFLDAMSNKAPKTIFIDGDLAMASAIAEVMPNTSHRLCMWHLMQNAMKHVNHLFQGENGIKKVLGKFNEEIEDEEQWLTDWDNMLEELDCRDNHWLKKTFKDRKKWAYPYIRSTWSAGKRSTQLSESFNSRLKDYLRSDHDLMQFFANFDGVLNDKRYKELESEYALIHKSQSIKVKAAMLIQAGQICTKIVFEEFFVQFEASIEAMILSTVEEMGVVMYMVKAAGFDKKVRRVTRDECDMIKCSCMMFEQKGYLCSHCIKVLRETMHVTHIPDQYVLKRWTRKARAKSVKDRFGCEVQFDVQLDQSERHRNLSNKWRLLTCRASVCDETYRFVDSKTIEMIDVVENMLSLKLDGNLQHHGNEASDSGEMGSVEAFALTAKGLKKKEATSRGKRRIIGTSRRL